MTQKYFLCSWVLHVMHLIASMVRRVGRNPKEYGLKSASKMGSRTIRRASCTIRSLMEGIPRGRVLPLGVGMVSVHVVEVRNSCQVMLMSRTITAHECRTSLPVRAVAAHPGCRPGLHSCARSTRDGVGGRRPAFGSDGSAPDRAAAARLAHLLPAPVERSASGDHETAPSRPQRPAGRRAARPRGAGTGAGAS